ncbi:MAG: Zn-ribbon domain-containing OB-fold protein [Gemmobacter sp.]
MNGVVDPVWADRIALPPPEALFTLATDRFTAPYWDAAAKGRLTVPRCADCGTWRMPPGPFCPACRSQALDWPDLDPRGAVHSFTVVTRALLPGMEASLPYVPATVTLPQAGGVRLIAPLVDVPLRAIAIGQRARVRFHRRGDGVAIPCFVPEA